ncbi:MAG: DUF4386 domain-containing protein [Thermoanaerobaculia bacterium]
MKTTKQLARRAGLLYFLLAVSAPLGLVIVPGRLFVSGNASATADNIRASGWLLRAGMASELVHQAIVIFLVLALYRLFVQVDEYLSKQVVILGALVSVPIVFVNVLNEIAALILVSGADFLTVFERPQRDALAYLFVRLHSQGIAVASIFWGLWLFPFGLLAIRSRFIPKFLGYLLWVAGAAYVTDAFFTLIAPQYMAAVSKVTGLLVMAEVPIIFWLLIWGAKKLPGTVPAVKPASFEH